jgi:hypothetical protein
MISISTCASRYIYYLAGYTELKIMLFVGHVQRSGSTEPATLAFKMHAGLKRMECQVTDACSTSMIKHTR